MKISMWTKFRSWLFRKLLASGVKIEVEARHGPFRKRHKEIWTGGMIRVDIPLQKQEGFTDTPMGRISSEDAKRLIDAFTGVEGEDPFNEMRPGRQVGRVCQAKTICALCGQEVRR